MITVVSGGTGTPKLLQGIKEIVDPEELTIIVNSSGSTISFIPCNKRDS